jgi:hypothetical protein
VVVTDEKSMRVSMAELEEFAKAAQTSQARRLARPINRAFGQSRFEMLPESLLRRPQPSGWRARFSLSLSLYVRPLWAELGKCTAVAPGGYGNRLGEEPSALGRFPPFGATGANVCLGAYSCHSSFCRQRPLLANSDHVVASAGRVTWMVEADASS